MIYHPEAQMAWLEQRSEPELRDWLLQVFHSGNPFPLAIPGGIEQVGPFLQTAHNRSQSESFKLTLEKVIIAIIGGWSENGDPNVILFELTLMVASLSITGAYDILFNWVKSERLKNRKHMDHDLHYHILRIIAGMKVSWKLGPIISRDFDNPAYAPILFRIACRIGVDDYQTAIRLLDRFLDLDAAHPGKIKVKPAIQSLLENMGAHNIRRLLDVMISSLSRRNQETFAELFLANGYWDQVQNAEHPGKIAERPTVQSFLNSFGARKKQAP